MWMIVDNIIVVDTSPDWKAILLMADLVSTRHKFLQL